MMKACKKSMVALFGILICWSPALLRAADPLPLGDLVRNLSQALHRGSWFQDRSTYYQRLYIERFKNRPVEGQALAAFYRRLSVAEVSPTEKGEVIARLVYDTDGDMKPKDVKPSSRNVFGAPGFLELVFFPLYPENVELYEILDLGASSIDGVETRMVRILPWPGGEKKPLVEGVFHVDPYTGRPIRLSVTRLHNFDALDSRLKKLLEFRCELDYRTLPNEVSVPWKGKGNGNSEVIRWNGFFNFTFHEWDFRPSALPKYAEVKPYYEKMEGFRDPAPPDTPAVGNRLPDATSAEPAEGSNGPVEEDLPEGDRR